MRQKYLCTVQFLLLPPPPPPGQLPGQSRPFWPRGGEFFKKNCPWGRGWGQVEIPTSAKTYGATQWLELCGVLCGRIFRICWIEIIYQSKNPCSECKCDQKLLLKHQNMFKSLCCKWFSFCISFFSMEGFFFKGSRLILVDVKSPGVGELSLTICSGGGE